METKCKVISGLKKGSDFCDEERHKIIQEYLSSGKRKSEIWYKYTGQREEHGNITRWMYQLNYKVKVYSIKPTFDKNQIEMARKKDTRTEDSFETLQLKKRIIELENQLKDAEMKAIAFSTMVDIAEKQFNIPASGRVRHPRWSAFS